MSEPIHYLMYDGDCELCQRLARAIQRRDQRHRLRTVTFDEPLAATLLASLPREEWRNTFHLILPDGTRESGNAALPTLLRLVPWGWPLAWLLRCPGLGRPLSSLVYRRLAAQHDNG